MLSVMRDSIFQQGSDGDYDDEILADKTVFS